MKNMMLGKSMSDRIQKVIPKVAAFSSFPPFQRERERVFSFKLIIYFKLIFK